MRRRGSTSSDSPSAQAFLVPHWGPLAECSSFPEMVMNLPCFSASNLSSLVTERTEKGVTKHVAKHVALLLDVQEVVPDLQAVLLLSHPLPKYSSYTEMVVLPLVLLSLPCFSASNLS